MTISGFDLCRAAMNVEGVTAPEQSVLLTLSVMANEDAQCWPGIAKLVALTKLSERTVQRSLNGLKGAGHLNWVDKPGRGRTYVIHPRQPGTPIGATPATEAPRQPDTRHSDTPATLTPTPATVAPKQPITTITSTKATPSPRTRASKPAEHRLPDDWRPIKFTEATVAREVIDRRGQEWARAALESFRNWAANAADRAGAGRKSDWQKAWANWVIEQDRRDGRNGSQSRNGSASIPGLGRTSSASVSVFGPPGGDPFGPAPTELRRIGVG